MVVLCHMISGLLNLTRWISCCCLFLVKIARDTVTFLNASSLYIYNPPIDFIYLFICHNAH